MRGDDQVDERELFEQFARPIMVAANDGGGTSYGTCDSWCLRVNHARGETAQL
ncbi:hypothetical protein GCM10009804_62630 [Kribbella hippodromi]|uniref:Uncharacterized protein n=1 Tax=Kribbella hippodromi TaxID=434347 RepID=A0ABN2E8V8_9ACTN